MEAIGSRKPVDVPLADIDTEAGTQLRVAYDEQAVLDYEDLIVSGVHLGYPELVKGPCGTYWPTDGFHRLRVYRKLGWKSADCFVVEGTLDDAVRLALGANRHGVGLKEEDKRKIVLAAIALPCYHGANAEAIARACGVSHQTVRTIRARLADGETAEEITRRKERKKAEAQGPQGPPPTPPWREPAQERQEDDREKPERKAAATPAPEPLPQDDKVPLHLRDILGDRTLHAVKEELESLGRKLDVPRLTREVRKGGQVHHWMKQELHGEGRQKEWRTDRVLRCLERMRDDLDLAISELDSGIPAGVCPHCEGDVNGCPLCDGCGYLPAWKMPGAGLGVDCPVVD